MTAAERISLHLGNERTIGENNSNVQFFLFNFFLTGNALASSDMKTRQGGRLELATIQKDISSHTSYSRCQSRVPRDYPVNSLAGSTSFSHFPIKTVPRCGKSTQTAFLSKRVCSSVGTFSVF